jgi:hypothetical protein
VPGLLPSEKLEVEIYKYVAQLHPPVQVSLPYLAQVIGESDLRKIVERLKDLEVTKRLLLSKYSGGQQWPPQKFSSDAAFFYRDSILIEVAPQGRKYFEELVQRAEQEETPMGGRNLHRGMLRTAFILNVLIASPSDVSEEREVVTNAVLAWNAANCASTGIMLNAVRWETHSYPASGDRPQAILNKQIVEQGDFLIGIFGNRLGTPTGDSQSGTIEEIEIFRKSGKHVALYFSTANVPRDADRDQLEALESYQRERQIDTLYATFGTPYELRQKVTQHLPGIVSEVYTKLSSSNQLEGIVQEFRATQSRSAERLQELAMNEPPVEMTLTYEMPGQCSQDQHNYRLVVNVRNAGQTRIDKYHLDVLFPTGLLQPYVHYALELTARRTATHSLFRVTTETNQVNALYPGDSNPVLTIDYYVNRGIFQNRPQLLKEMVTATLYVDGYSPLVVEKSMSELQNF